MPAVCDQTLEASQVELVLADLESVTRRIGVEPWLGQRFSQLRDVDLHHLRGGLGHVVAPQVVDDAIARDGSVRAQE